MCIPEPKHFHLTEQLRNLAAQHRDVLVPATDLITLLDYIVELERADYENWEDSMGENL